MQPIEIYDQWSVVVVPFPFTDKDTTKKRPALVLSTSEFQLDHSHVILSMITSAHASTWPTDTVIQDLGKAGLTAPSLIRFKIFTLYEKLILYPIGTLSIQDQVKFKEKISLVFNRS